jgi:transcriptional regulator PpsR
MQRGAVARLRGHKEAALDRAGGDDHVPRWTASQLVTQFQAPKETFGDLDAEAAAALIAAAADIALIVDRDGIIRDLAFGNEELSSEWGGRWLGQRWLDMVTVESRPKVEALLKDAAANAPTRWRHVNHPAAGGPDVPVLYSAMPVGPTGRVVAVGRDLRATAALQRRLVDAQQSMERDYSRLRHVETRYRLLFQMTSEAILIVDAASWKVVEGNPAAGTLLGDDLKHLVGRPFLDGFAAESAGPVQALLAGVRATGRPDDARARSSDGSTEFRVSASLFRQENSALFLVRLAPFEAAVATAAALPKGQSTLLRLAESAPDGLVVTDLDGRILAANAAFLDLAQLATEEQARGEPLERWLGRPGVDLNVLSANLRQHGSVRLFATTLRGEYGAGAEIEVSAVALPHGEQAAYGFTIRNVGRRLAGDVRGGRELPRSVEQLTELVGRVPLKDLVRETTDVIERLCIEAALELTGDNRASAAEILGLSRQSLYVKLRRYGLGDLASESDE